MLDGLFRFPTLLTDKHERRGDFLFDLTVAHEHHLPRKAVSVLCPSIFLTERIFSEFDECRAPFCKLIPQCLDFLFRVAGDEKRYSRSELEEWPRVDEPKLLPQKFNGKKVHRARRRVVKRCSVLNLCIFENGRV